MNMKSANQDKSSTLEPKKEAVPPIITKRRWPLFLMIAIAAILNGLAWALIFWKIPPTDSTVYLHYNIFFGIDLIGSWYQILWIPGSGTAALVLNTVVIFLSRQLDRFFKYLGLALTLAIQLVILLASVLVVLLNG